MRRVAIAITVAVVFGGVVTVAAIARRSPANQGERDSTLPRAERKSKVLESKEKEEKRSSKRALPPVESREDNAPSRSPLPTDQLPKNYAKAKALLSKLNWKKLGKFQLDWGKGKVDRSDPDTMAEVMRYNASIMELMQLWKDNPELKERMGREWLQASTDGYLEAMGIDLTDAQRELIGDFYSKQSLDEALGLSWMDAGKEGYEPLDSVKNSMEQTRDLSGALQGILATDQMAQYYENQGSSALVPQFQKSISASSAGVAIQKTSDYWMSRYGLAEGDRATVDRLAQEYYVAYDRLHQNYASADFDRRSDIWLETLEVQKRLQQEIQGLNPKYKQDLMSMDPYKILVFTE